MLEWIRGSDGREWDTTGTYFIEKRSDRHYNVFQRVSGEGDVRLNTARLSLTKCKELAQHFKDTTKMESVPPETSPPVWVEKQEVWCGDPNDSIRGDRPMADNHRTVPLPPPPMHACCSDPSCPDCDGYGIVYYDEEPLMQQTAESRTKKDGPEAVMHLKWDSKPQKDGNFTNWHTDCGTYRVSQIADKQGPLYASCTRQSSGHYWPLECDPPHSTHPKYYEFLRDAFVVAEQHYMEKVGVDSIQSNMEEVLKGIDSEQSKEYLNGSHPPDAGVSPKTSRGPKSQPESVPHEKHTNFVTEEPKENVMRVREHKARRLLKSLGFRSDSYDRPRLTKAMNQLASTTDEADWPKDEADKALLERAIEALEEDQEIEVIPDEPDEIDEEAKGEPVSTVIKETPRRGRPRAESNGSSHEDKEEKGGTASSVPYHETKSPKLVPLTDTLVKKWRDMDRYPRDRSMGKARKLYLRDQVDRGLFRGCEWIQCHVEETNCTYRMNGKHTSEVFSDLLAEGKDLPAISILVREYRAETLEGAAKLFSTIDSKQNARNKIDVIRGYAVAHESTKDFPPRVLNVLTAAVCYNIWSDGYRKYNPQEQAEVLLVNNEFAAWLGALIPPKTTAKAKHLIRMSVFAAMQRTFDVDADAATEFWTAIRDDSDDPKDGPRRVLYRYLLSIKVGGREAGERVSEKEVLVKCLQAWNAWRKKEKTAKLKYTKATELPEAI